MRRHRDHDDLRTVEVRPGAALAARPRLFSALEAAFPVSFRPADSPSAAADAAIVLCEGSSFPTSSELERGGLPVFAVGHRVRGTGAAIEAVQLCDHDAVDRRVRGVKLLDPLGGPDLGSIGGDEQVLASARSGAAWTVTREEPPVHRVRSSLPELEPGQVLRGLLADRPVALVALVHFLRTLTNAGSFEPPPLRAVLLFDDPNLRWRTYGFIDYARLLAHADAHGYHASMAMIPLDGRRPHRATADLFRKRGDRLSLVLHGNNHVSRELMRLADETDALGLAAQAVRRVASFESSYRLRVSRVMVPPHGTCSEIAARALGRLGFDALCAAHPLPWTEQPPPHRLLAGWDPGEFAGGCAVIPRIPFATPLGELAVRAFLGQPLVLYGHHNDLADGLDLLADTAARVNRLGDVRWTSLGEIAATNHAIRAEGKAIRVRPYSRRLRLQMPGDVRTLIVDPPRDGGQGLAGWSTGSGPTIPFGVPGPWARDRSEIRLRGATEVDPMTVPAPAWRPWPVLRRAATETRDRALALRTRTAVASVASVAWWCGDAASPEAPMLTALGSLIAL